MSWTTPADLHAQAQRLWDKGELLACLVRSGELFPLRLALRVPGSTELSQRFDEVRQWARALQAGAVGSGETKRHGYRIVQRELKHRVIGTNQIPSEAWLDTLDDALDLIGKRREARRFEGLLEQIRAAQPTLLAWLHKRPLRALELAGAWPQLLAVIAWVQAHPRPGVYLRQVDLPGVHAKFIEAHRGVLAEWLDLALPAGAVDSSARGVAKFALRYGFLDKPQRVRFRILDARQAVLANRGAGAAHDITLTHDDFARLAPAASRVFITENEINYLAFPALPDSLVIFGAGYGFDMLAQAHWLRARQVVYWGDIDTHGFAILDQLRAHFPHAMSLLMDRATLLAHRMLWTDEPEPTLRDLPRLTSEERALYDELRWQRLGAGEAMQVRLEQERIGFGHVEQALRSLPVSPSTTCSPTA